MGFAILSTAGTGAFLSANGIPNRTLAKVSTGIRPHVLDAIKNGEIQMIINSATGGETRRDGYMIRRAAIKFGLPYTTTLAGAMAMCARAVAALKETPGS
ncbi:MAG: hypothetical protein U5J82_13420 [Desulfobacterales bacterium]|nr:hypothetical protein [Desulfobacterales bacterium]